MIPAVRGASLAGLPRTTAKSHRGAGLDGRTDRKLGYVGIALILILGGLGSADPRGGPDHPGRGPDAQRPDVRSAALATCLVGVLLGDFVVYLLGFFYGEKVLSLPADPTAVDPAARSPDQGLLPSARVQDPGLRPVRPGLPHGGLPDGRHPQAARAEAAVDRPGGGVAEHVADVRAGVYSSPTRSRRGSARCSNGSRCSWPSVWVVCSCTDITAHNACAGLPVGPRVLEADEDSLPSMELYAGTPYATENPPASTPGSAAVGPCPAALEAAAATAAEPPTTPVLGASHEAGRVRAEEAMETQPDASPSRTNDAIGIGVNPPPAQPSMESPSRS